LRKKPLSGVVSVNSNWRTAIIRSRSAARPGNLTDCPRGHTHDRHSRRHIAGDYGIGSHGCAVPDGDAAQHGHPAADPHLVADGDGLRNVTGIADRKPGTRA
jgi:hypothetical protein